MSAHPAFDADRWYEAVSARRSRRAFDGVRPAEDLLDLIEATAAGFRPFDDARVLLVRDVPDAFFTGVIGSYGKVTGARSALVFIADGSSVTCAEHCGYMGEGVVLESNALGLATCWISGSFSRSAVTAAVDLGPDEVVRAISPLGHPLRQPTTTERLLFGAAKAKRRRPLEEIAPGSEDWPRWAVAGVESARIAPSAINRQPWRFELDQGAVTVSVVGRGAEGSVSRLLDVGIAMLHFEVGARLMGALGTWEVLEAPRVALFRPSPR